jgi:hypothetical protein
MTNPNYLTTDCGTTIAVTPSTQIVISPEGIHPDSYFVSYFIPAESLLNDKSIFDYTVWDLLEMCAGADDVRNHTLISDMIFYTFEGLFVTARTTRRLFSNNFTGSNIDGF